MGRTKRRRRKLNSSVVKSPNHKDNKYVNLIIWLKNQGMVLPFLKLAEFSSTGRGLMATSSISSLDTLINVPNKLIITRDTILNSSYYEENLPIHELLALFLIKEKEAASKSKWLPYIESLPTSYDVPYFSPISHTQLFPSYIRRLIDRQRQLIQSSPLHEQYTKDYVWAYFTVNTRAVYHDKESMALAPFLDMFNHTHQVSVDIKQTLKTYSIVNSGSSYKKYDQVFINYGPHDNIKLYVDYGFIILDNPHDSVPIDLNDILELDISKNISMIEKRKQIIIDNKFMDKMCITAEEGPSWNVYACYYILFSLPSDCIQEWWNLIYNQSLEDLKEISHGIIELIKIKLKEIDFSLSELQLFNHSKCSCNIAIKLMTKFQSILIKGIEQQKGTLYASNV